MRRIIISMLIWGAIGALSSHMGFSFITLEFWGIMLGLAALTFNERI